MSLIYVMDQGKDVLKDSDKVKSIVRSIIKSNDISINILERRLKFKVGIINEWLNADSKISHNQILIMLKRLGIDFQIKLTVGALEDPDDIRRINNSRNAERRVELHRETNEFIGLDDVSDN